MTPEPHHPVHWLSRWQQHLWRADSTVPRDVALDLCWLLGLGLLLIGAGIGLRDPWPADEPRFALVARDMVRTGQWLIPMIGGDTYADKPPLFFWLIASFYWLTGNLRVSFLLPSLLASLGSLALVYDLGRRLWNRETGLTAGLLLLGTVQFVWQGRQAQIDATVCFWIVLGLYGLLRHLLLGPVWRWFYIGCAACGFGIITKGVGFLPLLVLIPYFALRQSGWRPRPALHHGWRWALGPLALLAAVSVWLVPMLLASLTDSQLAAYRNEILFQQTIDRYASAWMHLKPFWYFLTNVIPPLWLPVSLLLIWAIPHWRHALRERDLRIAVLLCWVLLVVLFFSLSKGKRGVYVLPALPALSLALAPMMQQLWQRAGVRRVLLGLGLLIGSLCLGLGLSLLVAASQREQITQLYGVEAPLPLLVMGALILGWQAFTRLRFAAAGWFGTLLVVLGTVGLWLAPQMNDIRSSRRFVERVEAAAGNAELGWVAYNEENLLMSTRPSVNFGHSRWREAHQEAADAASWFAAKPGRMLLVNDAARQDCFADSDVQPIKDGNAVTWYLVSAGVSAACVQRGTLDATRYYDPR